MIHRTISTDGLQIVLAMAVALLIGAIIWQKENTTNV